MNLTIDILEEYRQKSDIIADNLVVDLHEELDGKAIWQLYKDLLNDLNELSYERIPKRLKSYFLENQIIPTWADSHQLKIAEKLFLEIGPLYSVCLLCRALPIGYSSAKTVKVLTSTGYLSKDVKHGTAKRLLETTQFIFSVMEQGALTPHSRGAKHILKVRFLHAMIRYHLQKHNWETKKYGIPINQEDMAGTILTFSVGSIKGLEQINVKLTSTEKDALVHFWAIVGSLIGVDDKLLPIDYEKGEQLYMKILHHQGTYSTDGEELTKALCNFIRGFLPTTLMPKFPEYLIYYLINDPKFSDIIGLSTPQNFITKQVFNSIISYFIISNNFRKNKLAQRIVKPGNKIFASRLIGYFDKEFNLKLDIPKKIQLAWGLE